MSQGEFVRAYTKARPAFKRYARLVKGLLDNFLRVHNITASTDCRAKTVKSFAEKIGRSGKRYANPLTDMTDLAAARVVCPDKTTVDLVCEGLKEYFEIDETNSVDKRKVIDADRFGYASVHLIVRPGGRRGVLPEWEEYREMRAEIQIRTILAHAWALVSHSALYKRETEVPLPLLRRLARLAALLEVADEEVATVRRDDQIVTARTRQRVSAFDYNMPPDLVSLKAYLHDAPVIAQLAHIAGHQEGVATFRGLNQLFQLVYGLGVGTLKSLDEELAAAVKEQNRLRLFLSDGRIRDFTSDRSQLVLFALIQRRLHELDPMWLCSRLNWDADFLESVSAVVDKTSMQPGYDDCA